MRARRSTTLTLVAIATLALGACGSPGSGGGEADPTSSGTSGLATCDPIAGEKLVVLEDDKGLQNADNIIPAVNKAAADANPAVIELLDTRVRRARHRQAHRAQQGRRHRPAHVERGGGGVRRHRGPGGRGRRGRRGCAAGHRCRELLRERHARGDLRGRAADRRLHVEVRTIGNRETYLPPLADGTLTAVPEYAATLADFLNAQQNGADAESVASADVDETVAALTPLAEAAGLTVGAASAAQDQNAFAVTSEFADGARPRPRSATSPPTAVVWSWPVRPSAPSARSASSVSRRRTASSSPTSSRTTSA